MISLGIRFKDADGAVASLILIKVNYLVCVQNLKWLILAWCSGNDCINDWDKDNQVNSQENKEDINDSEMARINADNWREMMDLQTNNNIF